MKKQFTILLVLISLSAFSQTDTIPPLITDRPDQTESAFTIPRRTVQLETGMAYIVDKTADEKTTDFVYNTSLIRFALFENLELRLAFSFNEFKTKDLKTNEETGNAGLSPVSLGLKIHIVEEKGWIPEIAFLGAIRIAKTGEVELSVPYTGPSFRLAFSNTISDHVSIGYNIGADWDGESANAAWFYSVAPGFSIAERWGCFIEAYGFIIENDQPIHMIDAGITFSAINNLQFDVSAGFGINDKASDGFVSGGLSWRIPK